MLWLTYRQHRPELFGVLAAAIAFATVIVVGAQVATSARIELGLDACPPLAQMTPTCAVAFNENSRRVGPFVTSMLFLYLFPALVASFIGGSLLSRDFERGTHRLAWTQGITRTSWLLGKLAVVALVAAAGAAIIAAVSGQADVFWNGLGSFRTALGSGPFSLFDVSAPAIVAYFVFAVAFGALFSVVFRRSLPAMFVALVGFIAIRGFVEVALRPTYLPPISLGEGQFSRIPADAWDIGSRYLTSAGNEVSSDRLSALFQEFSGPLAQSYGFRMNEYLAERDIYLRHIYQPADRYWLFQSIETSIFLGLALICVVLAIVLVRRRAV
jgi:ABC-type transport system involved in multi-copper enzyme maturation permease subunit